MKEEEKKKAINCRFQPSESDEFFQWLNNQSNMTLAIRNLIYHAIDLYGTSDFLAPETQKEVMRNTFIFEAAQNGKEAPVNPFTQTDIMSISKQVEIKKESGKKLVQEEVKAIKEEAQLEEKTKDNNIYRNIDINNL